MSFAYTLGSRSHSYIESEWWIGESEMGLDLTI